MAEIKLDHKELEDHIERYMDEGISLFIHGTTGIGKSQTVLKIAREQAENKDKELIRWDKASKEKKNEVANNPEPFFLLIDKRLSQMDPTDLRGIPDLNGHDTVEWKPPIWLKAISQDKAKGILFLDELNLAPPSIQSSAYQIINDHSLDEFPINKDVSIIAAGNRKSDKANVFDMAKPLQNRFGHCTLKVPSVDKWIDWAIEHDIDDRIIAYVKFKNDSLFKFDPNSKNNAFPTPRSWGEFCSPLIENIPDDSQANRKKIKRLASSAIGSGVATQFVAFLKVRDKINLEDFLKNPKKAGGLNQLDLKYSLLSLLAEWYNKNYKKKDLKKIIDIAEHLEDEFAILMLRMSKKKHPSSFKNNLGKIEKVNEFAKKYAKYLL